jgi:predicted metal-binding membrane protein
VSSTKTAASALLLIGVAAACWVVTANRMAGMDMGPGTDLGGIGWFAGVWATMMAAMMLPSLVPMARASGRVVRFAAGYMLTWVMAGLGAYLLVEVVHSLDPSFLAWDQAGPYFAGAVIAAAALYELTPVKAAFLRLCRDTHLIERRLATGRGAVRVGSELGAYCVGCCCGLMAALFAIGVMNIAWMAVIAVVIAVEKLLPWGGPAVRTVAGLGLVLAVAVALVPGAVPGLTVPMT